MNNDLHKVAKNPKEVEVFSEVGINMVRQIGEFFIPNTSWCAAEIFYCVLDLIVIFSFAQFMDFPLDTFFYYDGVVWTAIKFLGRGGQSSSLFQKVTLISVKNQKPSNNSRPKTQHTSSTKLNAPVNHSLHSACMHHRSISRFVSLHKWRKSPHILILPEARLICS